MRSFRRVGVLVAAGLVTACAGDGNGIVVPEPGEESFTWALPPNVAPPPVPVDNPMSAAKVELGRRLFYDKRLSGNGTFACASCHRQELSFSDGRPVPVGATGEPHTRNSQGLTNAGYMTSLGWAAPQVRSLETQVLIPMFGVSPVELGLSGRQDELLARLRGLALYRDLFARSFPDDVSPVSVANIAAALGAFQRTLLALNAPLDRFRRGESGAMSPAALRGLQAFNGHGCPQCHLGTLFTRANDPSVALAEFVNTGMYNIGGTGAYPARNGGLFELTGAPRDMGRMRVPSLRNVAVTAPYGHDGSVRSLEEVIDNYSRGGRLVALGPNAGDGRESRYRDPRITPLNITADERRDLVAFLRALTDSSLLTDRRFSDPWR